jgi:D-alanyl-lipoteichoic acid acyltransferase DltB (MBOAT superfamily)
MLPQYRKKRVVTGQMLAQGALLIFIGLFKKVAIADVIAPEVNKVFNSITTTPWPELVGGLWYFTIQLYCDFSGYSDIARGIACLLGFNLMLNFNQPFLARNISDYWRRWHISLSNWLRDYLFIPLGGSRGGTLKTCRNIMVTMLICGLWHGANWTFIIWGALNGLYLVIHRVLSRAGTSAQQLPSHGIVPAITYAFAAFFLFNVLLIPWLFFRAASVTDALAYMQGIFFLQGGIASHGYYFCKLAFFVALVLLIDIPQFISRDHTAFLKWHWFSYRLLSGIMLISLYGIMAVMIILSKATDAIPFIYFQF